MTKPGEEGQTKRQGGEAIKAGRSIRDILPHVNNVSL